MSETQPVVVASVHTEPTSVVAEQVSGLVNLIESSEFKIHGGEIMDFDSDLRSNNRRKPIDEGLAKRFTETEIVLYKCFC